MAKIGIITLNGYFNYGNRLQNYALQSYLESLGHEVETLRLNRSNDKNFKSSTLNFLKNNVKKIIRFKKMKNEDSRAIIFKNFSSKYIKETAQEYSIYEDLNSLNSKYDFVVIGSDQVWNPSMNKTNSAYFGAFMDTEKVISYSASFGVSRLDSNHIQFYTNKLNHINKISVREKDGARLVNELTGKQVPVLVDPTLLLDKNDWKKVAKKAPGIDKPYLLTYFLGGIPDEHISKINRIAKSNNLNIINLGDPNDAVSYRTGPSEFISYIEHCELFCTDSFHGTVFSILFEKPFIVYERQGKESMFSRIETLLETFSLQNRVNYNIKDNEVFNVDYSAKDDALKKEIEKSKHFLNNALIK